MFIRAATLSNVMEGKVRSSIKTFASDELSVNFGELAKISGELISAFGELVRFSGVLLSFPIELLPLLLLSCMPLLKMMPSGSSYRSFIA